MANFEAKLVAVSIFCPTQADARALDLTDAAPSLLANLDLELLPRNVYFILSTYLHTIQELSSVHIFRNHHY